MQVATLINEIKPRLQRLKLVDPQTGYLDEDEVLDYVYGAIRYLKNRYQLQHFLEIDRELFRTVADLETYEIPPNYGFWAPEQTRRSGISVREVADFEQITNLEYQDPARYNLYRSSTTSKPARFTVANNLFYFQPIPDTVYIVEAITRSLQAGDEVPESYALAVQLETLWRMAADQEKTTPVLADERTQVLRTLVNNESRFRQQFYTSRERIGWNRRGRYGR